MVTRINVDSGRPLESRAHYSRALRVGDLVLQSGTTAIDRAGNILGRDIRTQINAVLNIAAETMAAAGGNFKNLVRARLYVVGSDILIDASNAFLQAFDNPNMVLTVIPVSRLARPTQLVEIELEAVDGAAKDSQRLESPSAAWTFSGNQAAIRIADRILLSGGSCDGRDLAEQTKCGIENIRELIETGCGCFGDLVSLRVFIPDRKNIEECLVHLAAAVAGVEPTITLLVTPPLSRSDHRILIEAEAVVGSQLNRNATKHPHHNGFAGAIMLDEQIFISNVLPKTLAGEIQAPFDWAAQRNSCTVILERQLKQLGASLDDVVVRRYFTAEETEMNSDYGNGPSWFATTRPAALGCRIVNNLDSEAVLSLEAHAVIGAGRDIEWRTLSDDS
jgi:enamine deaminase RidA (YjgF/YER057c/UK114 family)